MTTTNSFRISIPVLAVCLGLSLHACHNAERSNPLDPESTPGVIVTAEQDSPESATVLWTRYEGANPFGEYWILRSTSSNPPSTAIRVEVTDEFISVTNTVPRVDTLAVITDPRVTSFEDTTIVANVGYVYRSSTLSGSRSPPKKAPLSAGPSCSNSHSIRTDLATGKYSS